MKTGPGIRSGRASSLLLGGAGLLLLAASLFLLGRLADDEAEQVQVGMPPVVSDEPAGGRPAEVLLAAPEVAGRASAAAPDDLASMPDAAPTAANPVSPLGLDEFLVDDGYEAAYAEMTPEDLAKEAAILRKRLDAATSPAYEHFNDTGRYEVVGPGSGKYTLTNSDTELLVAIRYDGPAGETRKIVLPEAEYPGAYALRRRWLFASRLADEKEREASRALGAKLLQDDD